jgi:hypothetical protein
MKRMLVGLVLSHILAFAIWVVVVEGLPPKQPFPKFLALFD